MICTCIERERKRERERNIWSSERDGIVRERRRERESVYKINNDN